MKLPDLSWREKIRALGRVAAFRPLLTLFIIAFSVIAALLEGVGLSFLVPIIEVAQSPGAPAESDDRLMQGFMYVYDAIGIPFTLGFIVLGVSFVMVARHASTFLVSWLRAALQTYYVRQLQSDAFEGALVARIGYFDEEGSDDILNAIVTQAEHAGQVIYYFVTVVQVLLLSIMYLAIAFYIAPVLTVVTVLFLGCITLLIRYILEPGYVIGDRVADANERVQQSVQAGTQGIRDVKLYTMEREILSRFSSAIDQYTRSNITLERNQAAIESLYYLSAALMVFALVYFALTIANLSLAGLGVFLFAMFQLAPKVSELNNKWYKVEGQLPHLVRTQQFTDELEQYTEPQSATEPVPDPVTPIKFDDVSFSYEDGNQVLDSISVEIQSKEFIAFVGQSGAGKSTVIKLLSRMHEPDEGEILADGRSIDNMDIQKWREQIAVVRQSPFIFNDTLVRNITIGNRDATDTKIREVCETAQIHEFLDDLPNGLETMLGDNGVRLSGGQRQRVSLARALLKDADVLVLDEATSDLDTSIEQAVQQSIESMDQEYSIIVIAHRLSTVKNADRIYTIADGAITEVGTHEELLDNEGKYAELYSVQ